MTEMEEKIKIQDWVDEKFKDKLTGRNIQQLYLKSDLVDSIYEYSQVRFNEVDGAFLAGLKESKDMNVSIKWHDLRKDKYDLPEDTYDVLDQAGYKVHYNFFQNVWVNEKDKIDEHVIAWCEIPQFEE